MAFRSPAPEEAEIIRARLPHVPPRFAGFLDVSDHDADELVRPGMPRAKLDGIPIPATSRVTEDRSALSIIESDPDAWRAVLYERRCDLCSDELNSEPRSYFVGEIDPRDANYLLVRGGMHRRCWLSASHWCPHLREGLLTVTMVAGSLSLQQMFDDEVVGIADVANDDLRPAAANVLGEYRIHSDAVQPEWPFREVRASEQPQSPA